MAQQVNINGSTFWLESCCKCDSKFAMDHKTYTVAQREKENGTFYCPHGHPQHYVTGQTNEDKLRQERDRLKQNQARLEDELREEKERTAEAVRSASAHKGRVTRIKNRVANGVCPCCNRSFTNLHQHMQNQHPDFKKQESA